MFHISLQKWPSIFDAKAETIQSRRNGWFDSIKRRGTNRIKTNKAETAVTNELNHKTKRINR